MPFVNKFKILVCTACLMLVGQAFGAWDGSIATTAPETETGADGKTYYLIDSEAKLAWFAEQVNGGQWSYNAKLIANLDMSNPDPSKKSLWTPIAVGNGGGGSKVFKGVFDGNKHVISNLYVSAEELLVKYDGQEINNNNGVQNGVAQNLGFIGCLSGTVKDLIIENIEVHGYGKGGLGDNKNLVSKPLSIGTIVGWQSGSSSLVDGCYATGVVITSGDGQAVGGIVGNVGGGTVSNCYSAVDIYASGLAYVGGIAGYTKNYNGNVTMASCVYAGETLSTEGSAKVNGKDSSGRVGAIIGYQYQGKVTLSDVFYDAVQFPGENAGIGATTGGSTSGSTTPQPNVNSAATICLLNNGTLTDGVCDKKSPWEMGESGPVLNEYSADGFKIAFDANGGSFAGNTTSAVKYVKQGVVINDDGLAKPSRDDFAFVGWSVNNEATEPDQNLGTASGAATITFKATPRTFPAEEGQTPESEKTVKVEKDKKIAVHGFEVPEPYHDNEGKKHSFMGWAFQENPSEADALVDENGLDNLPYATKDTTLYAVWVDATVFTVTFDANGHGTTVSRYQKTVYDQDNVSPLAEESMPHEDGYVLNSEHGWCVKPECGENDFFDFSSPISGNITLYANWDAIEYDVSYENLNGASNPNPAKYTAAGLTLEDLVSVDGARVFKGWCIDAGLTNCITELKVGSVGDTILYAKWEDVTYPIIYRAAGSGATGNVSQGVKYHGVPYTLLGESYNRPGYKQNGWTTSLTGEKLLDFGESYTDNASITFYPTWDTAHYTITYVCAECNENYGSGNPETYTMFEKKDLSISNAPDPDGYDFIYWYSDPELKNRISQIKKGSYGDVTLYGKVLKYYYLTYELNGGTKDNSRKKYTVETETFALGEASGREGYTFAGWYDNAEFAGEPVTEIPLGSTGDKTFYAKWIPNTYTVTYDAGEFGEGSVENGTKTHDVDFDLSTEKFTRSGYTQDGWENVNGDVVSSPYTENADITLYPHWVEKVYPFLVNDFGAIKVYEDENGKLTAEIDGMSTGEVSTISPEDNILVSSVNFNREFPVNETAADKMYSTIVLPFSIDTNKVPAAEFYELKSVDVENAQIEFWAAEKTLQANTPYIIRTKAATLSFNLDEGETVALNTSELNNSNSEDGLWEFRGTYSYIKWKDHADELGRAYGFRAQAENSYAIGSFARIGSSATTRPFRAYLLKKNSQHANRLAFPLKKSSTSLDRASIDEDSVPGTLDVVIVERETGETTAIGTLDTRTGEIKFIDSWFDMKGRRLNAKPTTKGIYYYNGKRVIVR